MAATANKNRLPHLRLSEYRNRRSRSHLALRGGQPRSRRRRNCRARTAHFTELLRLKPFLLPARPLTNSQPRLLFRDRDHTALRGNVVLTDLNILRQQCTHRLRRIGQDCWRTDRWWHYRRYDHSLTE